MATFLPHAQVSPQPVRDLTPGTPPDPASFYANNVPPRMQASTVINGSRAQNRTSGEYRGNGSSGFGSGNGALAMPAGPHAHMANGGPRNMASMGGPTIFDGPRSPPNTKNTSHVPCKFFRAGGCQAGKACPFSHSTDLSTVDTPCKYFSKGNCKFGAKCALAHILPNGRRVNRPNGMIGGHLNLGGRVDPQAYHHQDSALANSLLAQQANGSSSLFAQQYNFGTQDDYPPLHGQQTQGHDNVPTLDNIFTSHPGSKYGSPRDETRLPVSPIAHLSTLDAPLPASFDSQGISFMARHGPVAASVPSKFALDSPPSSLPRKTTVPSDALRNLHDSAFGQDNRTRPPNLGSSPSGPPDEYLGQRIMHSQRFTKPKMVSASLPRPNHADDWDDNFTFEEDFLPGSLHDLLTPQEKMRRLSKPDHDGSILRENLSGQGTPVDFPSKVGSPSTASPSRFGALFARQKREEESSSISNPGFGHVGSPLRNSSLHPGASPSMRAVSRPISGDVSPYLASPPRQSSMSMISQQLQRTRLGRSEPNENSPGLHPGSARHASNPTHRLDRNLSSSSIGTSRIDEEQADGVFAMEEEEDTKRYSGGWNYPVGGRSPHLGAIGGGRNGASAHDVKEGKEFLKEMETLYRSGS